MSSASLGKNIIPPGDRLPLASASDRWVGKSSHGTFINRVNSFHALPQQGGGFGKGREYDPDETGPWGNVSVPTVISVVRWRNAGWHGTAAKLASISTGRLTRLDKGFVRNQVRTEENKETGKAMGKRKRWGARQGEENVYLHFLEGYAGQRHFLKWCGGDNSSEDYHLTRMSHACESMHIKTN